MLLKAKVQYAALSFSTSLTLATLAFEQIENTAQTQSLWL